MKRPQLVGTIKTLTKTGKLETRLVYDQGEKTPATVDNKPCVQVPVWRTSRKEK